MIVNDAAPQSTQYFYTGTPLFIPHSRAPSYVTLIPTGTMARFNTSGTPNPNSLKITTDMGPFVENGMATFNSDHEAAGDPLGAPLMAIEGVDNVFALPQFLTVTKDPAADWNDVLPRVEAALMAYFHERR